MSNNHLYYIERKPKISIEKPPLLILMHGYGSNEQDLFSFAEYLPDALYIVSVRAPYTLGPDSYAWYSINFDADENKFSNLEEAKKSLHILENFIYHLKQTLPIQLDKIYLIGFSQGAILSYALALNTPKIQYVIALSGYLNEELITCKTPYTQAKFFISHGTQDPVIPLQWAKKAPIYLNHVNIKNTFQTYPIGHSVHPQNLVDLVHFIIDTLKH